MDRKTPEKAEIERLIRASRAARGCLENEFSRIRQQLDIPSRLKVSLKTHPLQWLAGSVATGFVARLLFARREVVVKNNHRSMPAALLGLGLSATIPFAKMWLMNQLKQWLQALPNRPTSAADRYPLP